MLPLTADRLKSLLRTGSVRSVQVSPAVMKDGWMLLVSHSDHSVSGEYCVKSGAPRVFATSDAVLSCLAEVGYRGQVPFMLSTTGK